MVQIYFGCGTWRIQGVDRHLGAEMVFDRYEGEASNRCVFKENPLTAGKASHDAKSVLLVNDGSEPPPLTKVDEQRKFATWRRNLDVYLGGGRFDLPPCQIRIKTKAMDTELPNLAFDVTKREISFDWKGMFDHFYGAGARLERRDRAIMAAAAEYMHAAARTTVGAIALAKKNKAIRRANMKAIRRERVKKRHLENHGSEFDDSLFEEDAEEKAVAAIERRELQPDFSRCAEDTEARKLARDYIMTQVVLAKMNVIREYKGKREDDEEGVKAIFALMQAAYSVEEDEEEWGVDLA